MPSVGIFMNIPMSLRSEVECPQMLPELALDFFNPLILCAAPCQEKAVLPFRKHFVLDHGTISLLE